jgi:hypothetical protein
LLLARGLTGAPNRQRRALPVKLEIVGFGVGLDEVQMACYVLKVEVAGLGIVLDEVYATLLGGSVASDSELWSWVTPSETFWVVLVSARAGMAATTTDAAIAAKSSHFFKLMRFTVPPSETVASTTTTMGFVLSCCP